MAPLSSNPDAWIDIWDFNTGSIRDLQADIQENVQEHITKECLVSEETVNARLIVASNLLKAACGGTTQINNMITSYQLLSHQVHQQVCFSY